MSSGRAGGGRGAGDRGRDGARQLSRLRAGEDRLGLRFCCLTPAAPRDPEENSSGLEAAAILGWAQETPAGTTCSWLEPGGL